MEQLAYRLKVGSGSMALQVEVSWHSELQPLRAFLSGLLDSVVWLIQFGSYTVLRLPETMLGIL